MLGAIKNNYKLKFNNFFLIKYNLTIYLKFFGRTNYKKYKNYLGYNI